MNSGMTLVMGDQWRLLVDLPKWRDEQTPREI